jgi:hypothetical protein
VAENFEIRPEVVDLKRRISNFQHLAQEFGMPLATNTRSVPMVMAVISGIAAFAVGVLVTFSGAPSPRVLAQSDCTQPSGDGCPMALDSTVSAAMNDASASHKWLLNVSDSADFVVTLKNLPADYKATVASPDGTPLGEASAAGTADKSVQITNAGIGAYTVTITSQSGDASDSPYTLIASNVTLTTVVQTNSYDQPARVSSYR